MIGSSHDEEVEMDSTDFCEAVENMALTNIVLL